MNLVAQAFYSPLAEIIEKVGYVEGRSDEDYRWVYINRFLPKFVEVPEFNKLFYGNRDPDLIPVMDRYVEIMLNLNLSDDKKVEFFFYHKDLKGIIDRFTAYLNGSDSEEIQDFRIVLYRALYLQLDPEKRKEIFDGWQLHSEDDLIIAFPEQAVLSRNMEFFDYMNKTPLGQNAWGSLITERIIRSSIKIKDTSYLAKLIR